MLALLEDRGLGEEVPSVELGVLGYARGTVLGNGFVGHDASVQGHGKLRNGNFWVGHGEGQDAREQGAAALGRGTIADQGRGFDLDGEVDGFEGRKLR